MSWCACDDTKPGTPPPRAAIYAQVDHDGIRAAGPAPLPMYGDLESRPRQTETARFCYLPSTVDSPVLQRAGALC